MLHIFRTTCPSNFGVQTVHARFLGNTGGGIETQVELRPTRGWLLHTRGPVVGELLDNLLDAIFQKSLI